MMCMYVDMATTVLLLTSNKHPTLLKGAGATVLLQCTLQQ